MNLPFCAQLYPQQSKPQAGVHRLLSQSKIIALDASGSPIAFALSLMFSMPAPNVTSMAFSQT
jgi:hypothetical protein